MQMLNNQLDDFVEIAPTEKPRPERLERSPELGELFAAMAKAQGSIKTALKTGDNPHFKSKYAKIDAVIEASQQPLAENGLCCMQLPSDLSGRIAVTTWLGHSSGQFIASTLSYPMDRANIQNMGSFITYLSRYSRVAILGIAPEDDDGEAAVGRIAPATDPKPPRHVGAFSKDQPPPEPIPPTVPQANAQMLAAMTGNGQETALREKVATRLQQKKAAALTEMQPVAPDDDVPPPLDDDGDGDTRNLERAKNIMLRQEAKARAQQGDAAAYQQWFFRTLNQRQRRVLDRNENIRALTAEVLASLGMAVIKPWWDGLPPDYHDSLNKAALVQKARAADTAAGRA